MADLPLSGEFLEGLSREQLLSLVRDPKVDPAILEHVVSQPVVDEEIWRLIMLHPSTPASALAKIARAGPRSLLKEIASSRRLLTRSPQISQALLENPEATQEDVAAAEAVLHEAASGSTEEDRKKSLFAIIKALSVGQKLALAKKGNKEARMILVRDANEMVALEAVKSPRITDAEILYIAQMRDVSEKVLREIANMKRYRSNKLVTLALLHNPKTPVGVSMGLGIASLTDREVDGLSKDRNIPTAVSRAAKQVIDRRKKPGPGAPGGGH
ncbi:MAG: hypothetical protein HYY54_06940 [candidate division NC10 bacterium]|nr:hypothetical protein [candidate division NC10 bacterium]